MIKQDYFKIRKKLNFNINSNYLYAHIVIDSLICGSIWYCLTSGLFYTQFVAGLLGAVLSFRAFSMMHDAVHGLVHSHRILNDVFGILYGAMCFLPFESWRQIHLEHHHWAGNIDQDPTMKIVKEFAQRSKAYQKIMTWCWRYWVPLFGFLQQVVFWWASLKLTIQPKIQIKGTKIKTIISFFITTSLAAGLLVAAIVNGYLFAFSVSLLTYLIALEAINLPHHLSLPQHFGDTRVDIWNQHMISRTCTYGKLFEKFIFLNFNYHTEHHLYPTLPWYRLTDAHQELLPLQSTTKHLNYSKGHTWMAKSRKLNIQDVLKDAPATDLDRRHAS